MARPVALSAHFCDMKEPGQTYDGYLLVECGCRPPGDPRPKYAEITELEARHGWACPH